MLTILEAGSPGSGVLVRVLFGIVDCHLLVVSSRAGRGKGALWGLFDKDTNPNHESSAANHFPKIPPPNTITMGDGDWDFSI